jgi:hypothetical protein
MVIALRPVFLCIEDEQYYNRSELEKFAKWKEENILVPLPKG